MTRRKPTASLDSFREYIFQDSIRSLLQQCANTGASPELQSSIISNAPLFGVFQDHSNWPAFVEAGLGVIQHVPVLKDIFSALQQQNLNAQAGHQEKRRLVNALGINQSLLEGSILASINAAGTFEEATQGLSQFGIDLILRQRSYPLSKKKEFPGESYYTFKRGCLLVEVIQPDTPESAILCSPSEGFMVIEPDRSVIIVSGHPRAFKIELIVMRDVPKPSDYAAALFAWLCNVVHWACYNRRNVRPTHPGSMTQIGLNMGARHLQILGWAKSFNRKLTDQQKIEEDTNLLGAMSLLWALVKSYLPGDVTQPVQALLDQGFPTMATRNIPEGCGFSIAIDGIDYTFNESNRAPPEGIATAGYQACSHTDACSVEWAFGWTVGRIDTAQILPANKGANFVDLGLKVVVENSVGTLTAFQPECLHGTTEKGGVMNYILALTSTRRVLEGYMDLEKSGARIAYSAETDQHENAAD
ncbi:hypothetical protein GALMADRAFT_148627 [Galerina marginata CBS 339.88]|uniref:Uncharacterized protein n=1 Tax=Galerina marginata (strain CBS 339.88) TaxID=685588 RepID=A0A067SFJ4_GALM3|nr:hypothetical protein GALMADRAFT_148627 [Galerina marginata CBS 339.88]